MTVQAPTTISGQSFAMTSYCNCNDGSIAGIGSVVGPDQFTTYTCEVGSISMPVTTVIPTDIPGVGGIPGCAAVVSNSETSAYCNCGGTAAPTLSPTASGFMNCAYTTQPTSSYNPASPTPPPPPPTTTSTTPPAPPYATGKCNVHVWQGLGVELTDPQVAMNVNITDANGSPIGNNVSALEWGVTLGTDSELPWVLLVTPQNGTSDEKRSNSKDLRKRIGGPVPHNRPVFEHGPVDFAYGAQTWDTSSSQCSVGAWDNGDAKDYLGALIFGDDFIPNRQMDCKFDCPGQ